MASNIKWHATKDLLYNGVALSGVFADSLTPSTTVSAIHTLSMVSVEEGGLISPFVVLSKESAKALMDELWNCGVRPSNEAGSVGEMAAVKYHLEDMRDIVKSLMELKK